MLKVAIQGVKGCFHEVAAYKYFGERDPIRQIECHSFQEMFRIFKDKPDTYGVMAIENTVAGTILPNYSKLMNSQMTIVGEVYLRIEQNLLSIKPMEIKDLKEVRSHPMALLQCLEFFKDYPQIKLIETEDTALSAKELSESQNSHTAVIASQLAGQHYGLHLLAKGIETNPRNFTRFLILRDQSKHSASDFSKINKASIYFRVGHTPGSLAKILTLFAEKSINLTKIQSMPVIGREWEYLFLVDLNFDTCSVFEETMELAKELTNELTLLGKYQMGVKYRTI